MQKLPVAVIAILFVLGCGSGTGASENQAATQNQDLNATAESSPIDAPAETPAEQVEMGTKKLNCGRAACILR